MGDFERALKFTLKREGGYVNDADDHGGETNFGITVATFNEAIKEGLVPEKSKNIKELTNDDVRKIYKELYWNKIHGDSLPNDLSIAVFDFAVNSYHVQSAITLQKILKVKADGKIGPNTVKAIKLYEGNLVEAYLDAREAFFREIAKKPKQAKFLKGWLNRNDDLRKYINPGYVKKDKKLPALAVPKPSTDKKKVNKKAENGLKHPHAAEASAWHQKDHYNTKRWNIASRLYSLHRFLWED